jgi:2-polyprenyl-6-methoxyphenol hydroxylase-like FAD-dependent oxidoreductase
MYGNLEDKSKIKLSKRISSVDHNTKEVIVLCEDGTAVSGDVLVGCDGVNSKVRAELWRISQSQDAASIVNKDQEILMAEYKCLFGISTATNYIKEGDAHVNYAEGHSTMFIGGKGLVYWFIFEKLDKVYKVPNIPRYTKHDAEAFASKFKGVQVTTEVSFVDVWENRKTCTLVPIEEAQMKRWTWGRFACVGDVVHKMTPNMGAGGNCAIE